MKRTIIILALHLLANGAAEPPLAAGESRLVLQPFDIGENLVPTPSFEDADNGVPMGWHWDARNTDATLSLDTANPRSGRQAVKITNGTAFGAHVFATLCLAQAVPVKPSTSYTISIFVKSGKRSPGLWIGGGEGWQVRRVLPATDGRWRRVSHTFVTGEKESSFLLRICTERPTESVWLDDISLREAKRSVPGELDRAVLEDFVDLAPVQPPEVLHRGHAVDPRWAPQRWPTEAWTFCGDEFKAEGVVTVAEASTPVLVEVKLVDAAGVMLVRQEALLEKGIRAALLKLRAHLGGLAPERLDLSARLTRDGRQLAQHEGQIHLVTVERVSVKLAPLAEASERLRDAVVGLEKQGLGAASRVTLTVLDNFMPWVKADLADGKIDRAWDTVCLLEQMAEREKTRIAAILDGKAEDFPVPRYVTGRLEISRAQTVGTRRLSDGREVRGPIFFTGYGHFGQVKRDIEKLPGYGCNIFQVEFGPSAVLPGETEVSDSAIKNFLALCDRAAAADVAVNLLLSPHYFPQWALEKWPHLMECHGGFFKYCVHDPAAREVIEKSLRQVIPRIKDHPALHSVCLSNEPVCEDLTRCQVTAAAWPMWLEQRHGTVSVLNALWGTDYAGFNDIPVPKPEFTPTPACLDFIRFNCETFAAFHEWMADVVHSMAPELPVHAKIMMTAHFHKNLHGFWSVNPAAFSALSQYNGNDASNMFNNEDPLWINGWRHCQAGYDFQRSMADLPVFNSENHLIVDRDMGVIPPEHIYSALWQNAVHGQSSTTLWVWERCNDVVSDLAGSILHRPDCVEAVGRCALDLNRLAHEVAALQNLAPTLALLWSQSSMVLGDSHDHHLGLAYEAANFLGQPLGFVTEEQLVAYAHGGSVPRPLDTLKVLLLPQVTHLPDAARAGLLKLQAAGVRVVACGDVPTKNDYNQPREAFKVETLPKADNSEALFINMAGRVAAWQLP
ncbi:MAG: beta-galactosidase, partial [Kiritimatiellae bacterium]|nr:beta-galactosidase [Kiritimatiellia bacterium]